MEFLLYCVISENNLRISKVEIYRLSGILNGLTTKETNITTPKTYDEIQERLRRLGYETNLINSITP